jgi:glucosamine 6-phosphate synthetase-like amidotransferase/phosphosugar isomerase protein
MCGVFGFITKNGRGPNLARLKRIALETELRGRHAFGLAWLGGDNKLRTFKRPGSASENLDDLDRCQGATIVVGHCRYATHGNPRDNGNNHPHIAGRGFMVHNGVVLNHAEIARRHRLVQRSECDSEVLGLLLAHFPGKLVTRAARVAETALGRLTILGVWRNPARLLIVRNGNPLSFGETDGGYYFGSLPDGLPGLVTAIGDQYAGVLTYQAGDLQHEALAIGK